MHDKLAQMETALIALMESATQLQQAMSAQHEAINLLTEEMHVLSRRVSVLDNGGEDGIRLSGLN